MDINASIKRNKKKKKERNKNLEPVFSLNCKLYELKNNDEFEQYKFSGTVKADKMDSDLMASILVNIIKESVPKVAIPEVVDLVIEKLNLVSSEQYDCKETTTEHVIKLLKNFMEG